MIEDYECIDWDKHYKETEEKSPSNANHKDEKLNNGQI